MSWSEIKKAVNSDLSKPLNELIDELEALCEQIIAPYTNNDNIDFIPTLYARVNQG